MLISLERLETLGTTALLILLGVAAWLALSFVVILFLQHARSDDDDEEDK